jgi:molybdate transport system substrate-binding protein
VSGRRTTALLALALAVAVSPAADARATAASSRLTVFAAASLAEVFPRIDPSATYSFAGSDQLAYQIEQGAPADVFAAASPKYPDRLYASGILERPVVFATNRLVLLLPRSNPAHIDSVFDLRRSGIRLVIGERGVPIGDYTRTVLATLGLRSALANVVSEEPDVKGIVGKVVLGEADAGFVYATDALPVAARTRVVALPAKAQAKVRYELAVVKTSRRLALARAFVRHVLGRDGRTKLRAAGFGPP